MWLTLQFRESGRLRKPSARNAATCPGGNHSVLLCGRKRSGSCLLSSLPLLLPRSSLSFIWKLQNRFNSIRIHAWLTLCEVRLIEQSATVRFGFVERFVCLRLCCCCCCDDVYIAFKLAFDSHCLKKFCYMNRLGDWIYNRSIGVMCVLVVCSSFCCWEHPTNSHQIYIKPLQ